jgi:glycosyltransferase involved in cell wall biosynthesis
MKILIITIFYPPEPLKIFSDLAEGLSDLGHEVTVLTTFPNHPSGKIYRGYSNTWPKRNIIKGVRIIRVPFYPNRTHSSIYRTLSYLSFLISICVFGPWLSSRPDIIYTVEPPSSGCAALFLGKLWRAPIVYEILDMWPETLCDIGMLTNKKLLALVGWFCHGLYKRAAALRVIAEGQKNNLLFKGVPEDKIFHIPNWVDTSYYEPMEYDLELAKEIGASGYCNVVYTGNLGRAQRLETVLGAAEKLRDIPKVQFLMFGDGTDGQFLRQKAYEMGLKNIRFMGSYPSDKMKRVCSIADCMLIHLHDKPAFRMAIPHKILSYLACGKPIIAAIKGDGADMIRLSNAGMICNPDDSDALSKIIREFLELPQAKRTFMGHNGRQMALSHFEKSVLVNKINNMLVQIIQRSKLKQ